MTISLKKNKSLDSKQIPIVKIKKMLKQEKYTLEEIAKKNNVDVKVVKNIAKNLWLKRKEKEIDKIAERLEIKEKKIKPFITSFKYKTKKFNEEYLNKETEKINRKIIQKNPYISYLNENDFFFYIQILDHKYKIEKHSIMLFAFEDFLKKFEPKHFKKYFRKFYTLYQKKNLKINLKH